MSGLWSMFWFKSFRKFFWKIAIFRTFDHWSEILSMSAGRPISQGVCPPLLAGTTTLCWSWLNPHSQGSMNSATVLYSYAWSLCLCPSRRCCVPASRFCWGSSARLSRRDTRWTPSGSSQGMVIGSQSPIFLIFTMFCTVPKIRFMFYQKWNCAALFPIPTFMYLWAIYIFPGAVCQLGCTIIGRPILGIYKLLSDTWMWKLGDRTLKFSFGNNEAAQFHFWEYINWNLILDSPWPFIYSVYKIVSSWRTHSISDS